MDKYDIKALGTKFSVEAYSANRNFKTLLYEGKVLVSNVNRTENIVLKPNQTAQLVDDKLNILNKADVNSIDLYRRPDTQPSGAARLQATLWRGRRLDLRHSAASRVPAGKMPGCSQADHTEHCSQLCASYSANYDLC